MKGFSKATGLWPLFFVVVLVWSNAALSSAEDGHLFSYYQKPEILGAGGPTESMENDLGAVVGSTGYFSPASTSSDALGADPLSADDSSLLGQNQTPASAVPARTGIVAYKASRGDTLSGIAAKFGITLQTVKNANSGLSDPLKKNQKVTILPVSGALYKAAEGDTLTSIAARFGVDSDFIKKYNPNYNGSLTVNSQTLLIPYADETVSLPVLATASSSETLPDPGNYFILPAKGWNWGKLHDYNAVDIANVCGSPVYAAAMGTVIEESSDGSWNGGYGNYVFLLHPNGTKTRYAHTLKNLVKVGDAVKQGEEIALMGNTGNTTGVSGCHVHFEVYGAKNPFALE